MLSETTLLALTRASVNHLSIFLDEKYEFASAAEIKELKEQRMKEAMQYDREFMQRVFNCTSYEEILNKAN